MSVIDSDEADKASEKRKDGIRKDLRNSTPAPNRRERLWIVCYPNNKEDVANTSGKRLEGREETILKEKRWYSYTGYDRKKAGSIWRNSQWDSEPDVGRVASRISPALDGGMSNEQMATKESGTESNTQDEQVRSMRVNGESTKASSRLQQTNGSENTLPDVPYKGGFGGWNQAQKTNAEMRDMREDVQSFGFTQAQDLQLNLSSNPRTRKRIEAVAWEKEPDIGRVATNIPNRVNRLKCLGNSIVPQIAELIFEQAVFDLWRTV